MTTTGPLGVEDFPQHLNDKEVRDWLASEFKAEGVHTFFPVRRAFGDVELRGIFCVRLPSPESGLQPGSCLVLGWEGQDDWQPLPRLLPDLLGFLSGAITIVPGQATTEFIRANRIWISDLIEECAIQHLTMLGRERTHVLREILATQDWAWLAAFANPDLMDAFCKYLIAHTHTGPMALPEVIETVRQLSIRAGNRRRVYLSPISLEIGAILTPIFEHMIKSLRNTARTQREDATPDGPAGDGIAIAEVSLSPIFSRGDDEILENAIERVPDVVQQSHIVFVAGVAERMVFEAAMHNAEIEARAFSLDDFLPGQRSEPTKATRIVKMLTDRYERLRILLREVTDAPKFPLILWPASVIESVDTYTRRRTAASDVFTEFFHRQHRWFHQDAALIINTACPTVALLEEIQTEEALGALLQNAFDSACGFAMGTLDRKEALKRWSDLECLCDLTCKSEKSDRGHVLDNEWIKNVRDRWVDPNR